MRVYEKNRVAVMNVELGILKPSKISAAAETEGGISLSLDAFIRSIGVRRTAPIAFFLVRRVYHIGYSFCANVCVGMEAPDFLDE